jgi:hypothetical protein
MIILKKTERITKVPIMLSPSQQRKNDILVDLLHRVYSSIIQSVSLQRLKKSELGIIMMSLTWRAAGVRYVQLSTNYGASLVKREQAYKSMYKVEINRELTRDLFYSFVDFFIYDLSSSDYNRVFNNFLFTGDWFEDLHTYLDCYIRYMNLKEWE